MSEPPTLLWFVEESSVAPTGRKIRNADRVIATVWGGPRAADDAALIVRAVNCHNDLVKALEHARRNLIVALRVNVDLGDDFDPTEHVTIKEIDAALSKAKAQP